MNKRTRNPLPGSPWLFLSFLEVLVMTLGWFFFLLANFWEVVMLWVSLKVSGCALSQSLCLQGHCEQSGAFLQEDLGGFYS